MPNLLSVLEIAGSPFVVIGPKILDKEMTIIKTKEVSKHFLKILDVMFFLLPKFSF